MKRSVALCVGALAGACAHEPSPPAAEPRPGLGSALEALPPLDFRVLKVWDGESERAFEVRLAPTPSAEPSQLPTPICEPSAIARGDEARWVLIRYHVAGLLPITRDALESIPREQAIERVLARAREIAEVAAEQHRGLTGRAVSEDQGFGPFLYDLLRAEAIHELCQSPLVAFVGPYRQPQRLDRRGAGDNEYPTIPQVLPKTATQVVQEGGFTGSGVKIALLEAGKPVDLGCFVLGGVQTLDGNESAHITNVMSMVGSRDRFDSCSAPPVGYAPAAELFAANAQCDQEGKVISDWLKAFKWAAGKKVDIVSMSFHELSEETVGTLSSRDVFFDYWAVHLPIAVFTSAGNEGCLGELCASAFASGKGYNFLGIANVFTERGRCETSIDPESSWRNPLTPHLDRELPELAMPGSRYCFDEEEDCHDFGGTSAATPAAAGIAALLLQANPFLESQPEATRAILLAGADYQLADEMLWGPSPWVDGHDGVGLAHARLALAAAQSRSTPQTPLAHAHDYGDLTSGMFGAEPAEPVDRPGGLEMVEARVLDLTWEILVPDGSFECASEGGRSEGECPPRVRVALAWNSSLQSQNGPSVLDLDLDLRVVGPDNASAWSATSDNSYELVAFEATEPGVHEIRVYAYDVPDQLENRYGLAWVVTKGCP